MIVVETILLSCMSLFLYYDMFPFEDGVFEEIRVKIPKNWDQHLALKYGNYMELPPEEERLGHKPYILDFGKY